MTEAAQEVTQSEVAAQAVPEVIPQESLLSNKQSALDFSSGRPEGFPEEFWDATANAPVVDRLFNSYQQEKKRAEGLRVKLSKGEFEGKAPADISEYTFAMPEGAPEGVIPNDDPLLLAAKEAAKNAGLPKETFAKFIGPVVAKLMEAKSLADTPPSEEEIAMARDAEIQKLGPSGAKIVDAVGSFISELESGGTFSSEEASAARAMVTSAAAARVMNKLRMMNGGRDQVPVDMPVDMRASKSDIEQKLGKAMLDNNEADYQKYSAMLAKIG